MAVSSGCLDTSVINMLKYWMLEIIGRDCLIGGRCYGEEYLNVIESYMMEKEHH